eukprot:TRINITY_DN1672_c0_g1_i3.p1 TRINITY_DN1672_c0_g1~~TRINITY_DN1672_c0_g1_i3.p1  ORF type:complete len:292 (-),score=70.42 TRINITY_DN1672_c0_g1_i3:362-1237(-)
MEDNIIPGTNFRRGNIVWAKISGYPWWPGEVVGFRRDANSVSVAVNFIGHKSHAYLPISKVAEYKARKDKNAKTRCKGLSEAIKIADKMVEEYYDMTAVRAIEKPREGKRRSVSTDRSVVVRRKSVKDAGGWIEELAGSEELRAGGFGIGKLVEALEIVKESVKEHEMILNTKIGINLSKLARLYGSYSPDIVGRIEKILSDLKDIVLEAYFGLKSETKESLDENSVNSSKQPEPEEDKSRKCSNMEEKLLEHLVENKEASEAHSITNVDLRNSVCHEIAKLIEEVFYFLL